MKILDRYILRKFFGIFLLCLIAFLIIFLIVDVIEKIDKYIKAQMSISEVLTYYLYQLPFFIDIAIPMSLLLASVFTIGTLSKNNELAAIKSSGVSLYRLSTPLLITGALFSIGLFLFEDYILIPATREKIEIEQTRLKGKKGSDKTILYNITYQDSPNCNIVILKFSTNKNIGNTVTIQYTQNQKLAKRIDAQRIIWLPEQKLWRFENFKIRNFGEDGSEIVSQLYSDSLFQLNLDPQDIAQSTIKPETMKYKELKNFIDRLKQSGNDPTRWEVNLHYKLSFPITTFIVILFGLPLAAMKHHKGIGFGAAASLFVIFAYYAFIEFGQILGYKNILPPFLSVWLGNFVFLGIGGYLFYKIRQ